MQNIEVDRWQDFVDKKEVTHVGLEGMSREQFEKRLSELESKIGEAKNIIDVTPEKISQDGSMDDSV